MSRVLPILFNTEMVQAILDGRKMVTRRICKDGNDFVVPDMGFYDADKRTYAVHNYADLEHKEKLSLVERVCPICPGDILYVRETFAQVAKNIFWYRADNAEHLKNILWRPSIHMPKEAARIWLKVTDVRVERLQRITPSQLRREGMTIHYLPEELKCQFNKLGAIFEVEEKKKEFSKLWDSTIKKSDLDRYGWDANPWVWVIEFKRCNRMEEKLKC